MDMLVISITALLASLLTLFSGFGLGTLLMPVVALFFPIEMAVAITAIVHLSNNLFKIVLLGRHAKLAVVIRFGIPAIISAFCGAWLLIWLSDLQPFYQYSIGAYQFNVSLIKLLIGILILIFVTVEASQIFKRIELDKKYLPLGGIISGFFGGLSGHQGAMRSMFLVKLGLSKESFVATGVMLAIVVDFSRMVVYGWEMTIDSSAINWALVIAAILSAFCGAFIGRKLLHKVTIKTIQISVSILLVMVAIGLMSGLL